MRPQFSGGCHSRRRGIGSYIGFRVSGLITIRAVVFRGPCWAPIQEQTIYLQPRSSFQFPFSFSVCIMLYGVSIPEPLYALYIELQSKLLEILVSPFISPRIGTLYSPLCNPSWSLDTKPQTLNPHGSFPE